MFLEDEGDERFEVDLVLNGRSLGKVVIVKGRIFELVKSWPELKVLTEHESNLLKKMVRILQDHFDPPDLDIPSDYWETPESCYEKNDDPWNWDYKSVPMIQWGPAEFGAANIDNAWGD